MNVLIIRLSSIGDVAMTVPVIDAVARTYPNFTFTVISQSFLSPFFAYMPENVHFFSVYTKGEHRGIVGIYKLFKQLKKLQITSVADLHNVIRSKLLRSLFFILGKKTAHIDKGRREKKQITRLNNKQLHPIKNSVIRYQDVFFSLGFSFDLDFVSIFGKNGKGDFNQIQHFTGVKKGKWIGIAPFAKHHGKIYPLEKTEEIIAYFSKKEDIAIFLFGNGEKEQERFNDWIKKYANIYSVIGKLSGFTGELILMSYLDVMFSMDSANMHLASLTNTPVVSTWGATHPYTGFYGWNQSPSDAIQVDIPCRPCSVYGNKPCFRKDYACFAQLPYHLVIKAIEKHLNNLSTDIKTIS